MTAWNDTFDESTDWSSVAFLNMFVNAVNERMNTGGIFTPGAYSFAPIAPVIAGDDVQVGYSTSVAPGVIYNLQAAVLTMYTDFVDVNVSLSSIDFRTSNSQYTTTTFAAAGGYRIDPISTGTSPRRKRPREISTATATADYQGNAAVSGQIAWFGATLYQCVASGNWTVAPAGSVPDVLDSYAGTLRYGLMQAGDYIGPHIFQEIRDSLNVMTRLVFNNPSAAGFNPNIFLRTVTQTPHAGYSWDNVTQTGYFTTSTSYTSMAALEGAVTASFPATITTNLGLPYGIIYSATEYDTLPSTVPHYSFVSSDSVYSTRFSMPAARPYSTFLAANPLKPRVYYYMIVVPPRGIASAYTIFDANGVSGASGPIVPGTNLMGSQMVDQASCPINTTYNLICYPLLGDFGSTSTVPTSCGAPPVGYTIFRGWQLSSYTWFVEDYDVAGGFAYTVHT